MKYLVGVPGLVLVVLLMVLGAVAFVLFAGGDASSASTPVSAGQVGVVCAPDPSAGSVAGFTGDQLDNAAVIVAVGKSLRVPERGLVVAVATSMQEATLHNLGYGDTMSNGQMSSSRGLFQQLQTYGPDRTVPARAAEMFYNGGPGGIPGLLQIAGWQSMSLAQAAEAVQRSAQPELYAKWEQPANQVRSLTRLFCSEPEDKPWYNDREMWPRYFDMLVSQRFNRFNLAFGIGYDFIRKVTDSYFLFTYPFLLKVPGYNVRVPQLSDAERDRNLEMLTNAGSIIGHFGYGADRRGTE